MDLLFTNFYIFLMATVLAVLEIQIEGEAGWAKNLPTWRPKEGWFVKIYSKLASGRELTGYHLTMFVFVALILHLPYAFGLPITVNHELRTISYYFIFLILWDFLWFVLNPSYPLSRFKKEHILWHPNWFLFAPVDYFILLVVSFLIIVPTQDFVWWIMNIALFSIFTFSLILFSLYILNIDKWSKKQ